MGSEFDYTQGSSPDGRHRDINEGLYQKFYIVTPVEDAEFTFAAEATNMREVTIQIVDPAGDAMEEQFQVGVFLATDATGLTAATAPDGGVAVTTGSEMSEVAPEQHINYLTDATGLLVIEITESTTKSFWVGVFLPNGKYTVSEELAFA